MPVPKRATMSTLNDFNEYDMLNAGIFARHIGFTTEEVKQLCVKFNMNYEDMKDWYDGYCLEGNDIYNSSSVVKAILNNKYACYFGPTMSYDAVLRYINNKDVQLKKAIIQK